MLNNKGFLGKNQEKNKMALQHYSTIEHLHYGTTEHLHYGTTAL